MAGITLPSDATGISPNSTRDDSAVPQVPDKPFTEKVAGIPGALYQAATGEGIPIEFPDVPEASDMGGDAPGFIEGIIPNLKIMMARDDYGKTEIMQNAFKDDERWGGAFTDKYGNPMIVWNGNPYYVNKPGFSGQDFGTFVGEIYKFLPATKIVGGAKTLFGTVARGIGAYGTTETAGQALEAYMTPETTKAKDRTAGEVAEEIGIATGIGVGADVVLPPALKAVGKGVKAAGIGVEAAVGKQLFPRFGQAVQDSPYPLTQGQRTSPLPDRRAGPTPKTTPQLEEEDVLRRAAGTDTTASQVIRGFDEQQLDMIRNDAQALQTEFGSGRPTTDLSQVDVSGVAAEEAQAIAQREAARLKGEAGAAYTDVRNAPVPPMFTREGLTGSINDALNAVSKDLGITPRELINMPILAREMQYLKKLAKVAENPRFKDQPLALIHGYQKSLNRSIGTAPPGSPEALALGKIKAVIDDAVFNGIERGIIYGDQAVLDQLKNATQLYRDYAGLVGKGKGGDTAERASNKILEQLTSSNYTPRQVANALFGHNKFAPNQSVPLVIDKLKASLPEESYNEIVGLLKDAILEKAFSGAGKSGVTRTNIVNNFDDVFVRNRAIIKKLFTPEEVARVSKFREDVMPTLWAEIKLNPSNTGYTLLSAMTRSGLMNFARGIPIVGGDIVQAAEGMGQRRQAMDVVRQYVARTNQPLLSGAIQAPVRPVATEEVSQSQSSPALQSLLQSLPASEREKIIQQGTQ